MRPGGHNALKLAINPHDLFLMKRSNLLVIDVESGESDGTIEGNRGGRPALRGVLAPERDRDGGDLRVPGRPRAVAGGGRRSFESGCSGRSVGPAACRGRFRGDRRAGLEDHARWRRFDGHGPLVSLVPGVGPRGMSIEGDETAEASLTVPKGLRDLGLRAGRPQCRGGGHRDRPRADPVGGARGNASGPGRRRRRRPPGGGRPAGDAQRRPERPSRVDRLSMGPGRWPPGRLGDRGRLCLYLRADRPGLVSLRLASRLGIGDRGAGLRPGRGRGRAGRRDLGLGDDRPRAQSNSQSSSSKRSRAVPGWPRRSAMPSKGSLNGHFSTIRSTRWRGNSRSGSTRSCPPGEADRARWASRVFEPLSAAMLDELRGRGLDLARPEVRAATLSDPHREALAEAIRGIAQGFRSTVTPGAIRDDAATSNVRPGERAPATPTPGRDSMMIARTRSLWPRFLAIAVWISSHRRPRRGGGRRLPRLRRGPPGDDPVGAADRGRGHFPGCAGLDPAPGRHRRRPDRRVSGTNPPVR